MSVDRAAQTVSDGTTAVEATQLRFAYADRVALDGISFRVTRGEIFGFLGPNGGGKTTLFRILATLAAARGGSAEILGADPATRPGEVRRRLGVVFQSPSLDPHLTVAENLRHQGHLYGLRGEDLATRAATQLERFGLVDRGGDLVKTLSGGLQRRIEIAKALLHGPELLLLDEPGTGLDPGARRDFWNALETLRADADVTVLLTTHFMEEADRCDRLALLDRGRIVAQGSPAELKRRIGGDVIAVMSRDAPALAAALAERFGIADAVVAGNQVRFEREDAHEFVAELAGALSGRIEAVTVAKPTLEDVFLAATGHGLDGETP